MAPSAPGSSPQASLAPGAPTSYELLDRALADGAIDEEHATLYAVFAAFGDPRLPPEYAGAPVAAFEPPVDFTRLSASVDSFSPEVRDQIAPFLIPPMHRGSWWDLRHNGSAGRSVFAASRGLTAQATPLLPILDDQWSSVLTDNERVRIWYPAGSFELDRLASSTKAEIDFVIWPRLVALMGSEPLPDGGLTTPAHGTDEALDLVLQNDTGWAFTFGRLPNLCERASAWVLVDPRVPSALGIAWNSAIAHELMHAFQYALDYAAYEGGRDGCSSVEYEWWAEATATWTEEHVYPDSNSEWSGERGSNAVRQFMTTLSYPVTVPLIHTGVLGYVTGTSRSYGAYLFPFYLARRFGPTVIATAFREMAGADSLPSIDTAVKSAGHADGVQTLWDDFALAIANEPPFDFLSDEDGISHQPLSFAQEGFLQDTFYDVDKHIRLGSQADWESAIGEHDGHLEVRWYWGINDGGLGLAGTGISMAHYRFTDPKVRSVAWYNGMTHIRQSLVLQEATMWYSEARPAEEVRGLSVQALIRLAGDDEWRLEDWTTYPYRTFCRDVAAERIEQLLIIVSNGRVDGTPVVAPGEPAWSEHDSRMWVSDIGCYRWEGTVRMEHHSGNFDLTIDAENVVFERINEGLGAMGNNGAIAYRTIEGQMRWTLSNSDDVCTEEADGTTALDPASSIVTWNHGVEGTWYRSAGGGITGADGKDIDTFCGGELVATHNFVPAIAIPADGQPWPLEDGGVWAGTSSNGDVSVTWDLTAVAE